MSRSAVLLTFFFLIQVTGIGATPLDILRPTPKLLRAYTTKYLHFAIFVATSLALGFLLGKVYARSRRCKVEAVD